MSKDTLIPTAEETVINPAVVDTIPIAPEGTVPVEVTDVDGTVTTIHLPIEDIIEEPELENHMLLTDFDGTALKEFYEFAKLEGKKNIFVVSNGGSYAVCLSMVNIINKNPEEYHIQFADYAYSAGFYIMLFSKCTLEEIGTEFHCPVRVMQHGMSNTGKMDKSEKAEMERNNDKLYAMIEDVLTDKQKEQRQKYVKWVRVLPFTKRWLNDDIYLDMKQLKELFKERLLNE